MNIKVVLVCLIALRGLDLKSTKKKRFEDDFERQLMEFDSGDIDNPVDTDDSS